MTRQFFLAMLAATSALGAVPAMAQDAAPAPTPPDPAVAPPPVASATRVGVSYTPADFARFAPKTAADLIANLPGFTVKNADQARGLGQASENILINGQRVTDKSGGALDRLRNTPVADVERIEVVDAAGLGIPGLSGAVANIQLKKNRKNSGSFEYRPEIRSRFADPNLLRGKINVNGTAGLVDYSLIFDNNANRGAFGGGDFYFRDAGGARYEDRDIVLRSNYDQRNLIARFKVDAPGTSELNLSGAWRPYRQRFRTDEGITRVDGDNRQRSVRQRKNGYVIDFNGDYSFDVGPGRLKLIGTRQFDDEPSTTTVVTAFDSGAAAQGIRFIRNALIGETVLRGEYGGKMGKADWQVSAERADNRLKQSGRLFTLDPAGDFTEVALPGGSGEVREIRYETVGSYSRPLGERMDIQLAAGAEVSRLERVDGDVPARNFFRPKGSAVLGFRPAKGWDGSFALRRRVGQISFYDFLAQPNLQQDRQNSGNPDLVPPQSWEAAAEMGRDLGAWGKVRLRAEHHWITDIVDVIPIGASEEGIGNLPRARQWGGELTGTLNFDPIGWKGAKLDVKASRVFSRVRDPITAETRPISGSDKYDLSFALRHDIPGTVWAWGAFAETERDHDSYFPSEVGGGNEGPFVGLMVQNKDVMGLDVRFDAMNLAGGVHRFDRTVYAGRRNTSPISFIEHQREIIGPIWRLTVKGGF